MFAIKLSLFCLCAAAALVTIEAKPSSSHKFKCNAEEKHEMDDLVGRIMTYGRSDRKYPVSAAEMKSYCQEQNQLINRLEAYKNQCLKSRSKQLVSVIAYSIRQLTAAYCKNLKGKRAKDLIYSATCANTASKDYLKCSQAYTDLMLAVENVNDEKQLLGQVCCGYIEIFKCVRAQANKHKKSCNDNQVEINSNYIKGFFDNAVNVLCGDYNDQSDKCDKFPLIPLKKNNKARPISYFSPLVNVLVKL